MKNINNNLTKEQIKQVEELEKSYNNHNSEKCKVDCCMFCYMDKDKKTKSNKE